MPVELPFNLAVSMRAIKKYSSLDKFGYNPTIAPATDPEDVWEGGGTYNFSTSADIVSLASSEGADNQVIEVQGLDENWEEVTQLITLNGTTRVALDTALIRVYRMVNQGTTNLAGTVFCYTGIGTVPSIGDPEIRAVIENGNNQTLMAIYSVPAKKVAFLHRGEVGIEWEGGVFSGTEFAKFCYESRRFGGVFAIKKVVTCTTNGSSVYQDERSFPDVIPAQTDIKLVAKEVSTTMGAWGTFDILLVDEDEFTKSYLKSIGQPGY